MSDNIKKESSVKAPPLKIESASDVTDTKTQGTQDENKKQKPAGVKANEKAAGHSSSPKTEEGPGQKSKPLAAKEQLDQASVSVVQWFEQLFPGHAHAVIFGLLGFLVAILLFIIGFWKTLLIVILVVIGTSIGQALDGDPKLINMVKHIWFNTRN